MNRCQPVFQKMMVQQELTATQKLRRQVRTIAEGAGFEIITYALTTPESS